MQFLHEHFYTSEGMHLKALFSKIHRAICSKYTAYLFDALLGKITITSLQIIALGAWGQSNSKQTEKLNKKAMKTKSIQRIVFCLFLIKCTLVLKVTWKYIFFSSSNITVLCF